MKRALSIIAAILMLLAISPQPVGHTEAPHAALQVTAAEADQAARHTPTIPIAALQNYITVQHGDTYSKLAITHCGTVNAWPAIQHANGWPERRIPIGARAVIVCQAAPPAAKPAPKPTIKPATPPTVAAWVHPLASAKQGNSCYRTSKRPGHNGIDIAQPSGTPIRAASAGTIQRKAYESGGAGYYVTVRHTAGVYTRYHHLRAPTPLPLGAHVNAGQTIGHVGRTGNATGNHLHFEVMRGGTSNRHHLNPSTFMRNKSINIGC